jgi:hypothetical protein
VWCLACFTAWLGQEEIQLFLLLSGSLLSVLLLLLLLLLLLSLLQDSRTVMAFVATAAGGVRAVGWQLFANPRGGAGQSVLRCHLHCSHVNCQRKVLVADGWDCHKAMQNPQ